MKISLKIITLTWLFLSIILPGFAQSSPQEPQVSGLICTHQLTGKLKLLKAGRRIKVHCTNKEQLIIGHYYIVNDSTIQIGDNSISIASISSITAVRSGLKLIGWVLALPSAYLELGGASLLVLGLLEKQEVPIGIGAIGMLAGLPTTATSLALIFSGKTFHSNTWRISVRK